MLMLRVTANTTLGCTSGRYCAAFVDEIDVATGYVVNSLPLPTAQSVDGDGSTNYRCTLPFVSGGEAFPQQTLDGRAVTFPCYDGEPGALVNHAVRRVFAAVWADSRLAVDTKTSCADCFNLTTTSNQLRSATSTDVFSGFMFTGISGAASPSAGIRFIAYRGTTSTRLIDTSSRFLTMARVPTINGGAPVLLAALGAGAGYSGVGWAALPSLTSYAVQQWTGPFTNNPFCAWEGSV